MVSYLGSLVQFSPAAGRAGAADRCRCVWGALAVFRPHGVCPVQGCLCFPRLHCSGSIWSRPCVECGCSFRVRHKSADSVASAFCAFPGLTGSVSQGLGRPFPGCGVSFPSAASGPGSQRLRRPLTGRGAPFPSAAPARAACQVSGSLQTGTGACLPGGRGWLL